AAPERRTDRRATRAETPRWTTWTSSAVAHYGSRQGPRQGNPWRRRVTGGSAAGLPRPRLLVCLSRLVRAVHPGQIGERLLDHLGAARAQLPHEAHQLTGVDTLGPCGRQVGPAGEVHGEHRVSLLA